MVRALERSKKKERMSHRHLRALNGPNPFTPPPPTHTRTHQHSAPLPRHAPHITTQSFSSGSDVNPISANVCGPAGCLGLGRGRARAAEATAPWGAVPRAGPMGTGRPGGCAGPRGRTIDGGAPGGAPPYPPGREEMGAWICAARAPPR